MKNIGASVGAVLTSEKKEAEAEEVVEEEYHQMENETIFFPRRHPSIKYRL